MTKTASTIDLASLYGQAATLTQQAAIELSEGDPGVAAQKLADRRDLMRQIQRGVAVAPRWGSDERADAAALAYLAADRQLEALIDKLERA